LSIAEETRLRGLKIFLEHEKTKLELGIKSTHEQLTGYDCSRPTVDLIVIYKRMINAGYLKADQTDFITVFKNEIIVEFKPIVWCIKATRGKNVGKGNKAALREFLKLCLQKESLLAEDKRKTKAFFVDQNNTHMIIQNPSKDESSSIDFKSIFSGLD
jgi:hypothetical protein